jgi:hypothetical protein
VAEWYYIGHYGQLGPLTQDQVDDLIGGGVIERDTFVWHPGLANWEQAAIVPELREKFLATNVAPPPPPTAPFRSAPPVPLRDSATLPQNPHGTTAGPYSDPMTGYPIMPSAGAYPAMSGPALKSDRNRIAAGVLNIVLPGVGRMYLGYIAYGVLQLVVSIATCGIGTIWPFVDGILMLVGSVRTDGYGRSLD